MEILPLEKFNHDTAELLVADVFGSKIWRISDNQYAIQPHLMKYPVHLFKSIKFTKLLDAIKGDIVFVTITENQCWNCPCQKTMVQIRVLLKDKSIVYIEHNDTYVRGEMFELEG